MANTKSEFGMKLMKVVGAASGVTYVSAPISTGYRDLSLMRELGVTKEQLRQQYPALYRERVIGPNEREAHKYAQMVRRFGRDGVVINPGDLYVPDWTQRDYIVFWEETIRSFCMEVVLAPGWEYSAGARFEASVSLQTMLKICDLKGQELTASDLLLIDARARAKLSAEGYERETVDGYMPWIDFASASSNTSDFNLNVDTFSDIIVRHNFDVRRRKLEGGTQSSEQPDT